MTPEVVPVRRVNYIFVAQFRIASLEFTDHIVRLERAKLLFDVDLRFGFQRHGPELFRDCRFLQRIKILTTSVQQFLRAIESDPTACLHGVRVFIW